MHIAIFIPVSMGLIKFKSNFNLINLIESKAFLNVIHPFCLVVSQSMDAK